jgi:catechol 2,3-dioxygenase-like lactoylglutathione lyase family enzyme
MATAETAKVESVDMKLEVVVIGVSDVDRAKAFYEKLGWRLDADFVKGNDFRVIQFTPHNSPASIIFGKGVPSPKPGSVQSLTLAVDDIEAARNDLIARGAKVSEVFQYAGGPFNSTGENPRVTGRDPQGRSYFSFASFEDPDGNGWLLQEVTTRAPGREWEVTAKSVDVAKFAELLRETSKHHDHYEKTHAEHHWWDWYAPYLNARQSGSSPDEAAAAADRYMDEVHRIPSV